MHPDILTGSISRFFQFPALAVGLVFCGPSAISSKGLEEVLVWDLPGLEAGLSIFGSTNKVQEKFIAILD